jgi:hypothetical protein
MLLGDPAGQGRADRPSGNVDRIRDENSREPLRPERDGCKCVVVGKRGHHYIAGGKIRELRRSADARKRRYPLRVSVIDGHLITVFNKVDGKACPIWPRPTTPTRLITNSAGPEGSSVAAVEAVMGSSLAGKREMRGLAG